ncbi:hypothetical protein BYT27DRAFT_7199677 [Phlegmacium glaucopus]|nr:hypothetical protein BYT27DRAFT_7199677 [Phlegmacium glaucopus]
MSQVNMSPPHISQIPQSYPTYPVQQQQQYQQPQQYQQAPGDPNFQAQNAMLAGQSYRDQLFAQCALGNHERKTEYGMFGIIMAVACFPCGLICLFMDTQDKCSRCGVSLQKQ